MALVAKDPFDVAPGAARYTRFAWLTCGLGTISALFCAVHLGQNVQAWYRMQDELAQARNTWQAAADLRKSRVASEPAQTTQARLALQRALRLSWDSLFAVFEEAGQQVDGRASITTLSPVKVREQGSVEVSVTALAVSPDVMVQYLRALEGRPQVQEVQLVNQQPMTHAGAQVVRFQAMLLWAPTSATAIVLSTAGSRRGQ